jgi:hypothetical protein
VSNKVDLVSGHGDGRGTGAGCGVSRGAGNGWGCGYGSGNGFGYVSLWGTGSENSQQIADWYSLAHFLHGVIIALIFRMFFPKVPLRYAFLAGIVTAVLWEVIEHTEYVLNRFRTETISLGYFGDAVINSMCDAIIMSIGLYTATRLRTYQIFILIFVFELLALIFSHDSLILSTIMLIHPIPAIKAWQLTAI